MSKKLLEPNLPRGFEDSFGKSLAIEKCAAPAAAQITRPSPGHR